MKIYTLIHVTPIGKDAEKAALSFKEEDDAIALMTQAYEDSLSAAMSKKSWKNGILNRTAAAITYDDDTIETFEIVESDLM